MLLTFICTENSCVDCMCSVKIITQWVVALKFVTFRQFVVFEVVFMVTEIVIKYFVII